MVLWALECDEAFTIPSSKTHLSKRASMTLVYNAPPPRSDALAKHKRTVHETEALRPSDPVPEKYSSIPPKPQRLKLIVHSKPPDEGNGDVEVVDDATIYSNADAENDDPEGIPVKEHWKGHFTIA